MPKGTIKNLILTEYLALSEQRRVQTSSSTAVSCKGWTTAPLEGEDRWNLSLVGEGRDGRPQAVKVRLLQEYKDAR
jgi:hypothetical protein